MQTVEELRDILAELQSENGKLRLAAEHGKLLLAAIEALLSSDEQAEPFAIVFDALQEAFKFDTAVALIEAGEAVVSIAAQSEAQRHLRLSASGPLKKALKGRVTAISGDSVGIFGGTARSALCLPISLRDKRGALVLLRHGDAAGFSREDVALGRRFAVLANQALVVRLQAEQRLENQRLEERSEQLQRRAFTDELTGLPNRAHLEYIVNEKIKNQGEAKPFALAFFDIDKFKSINDYYGHAMGDRLLIEMSKRAQQALRGHDIVARLSGDEFIIVIHGAGEQKTIEPVLKRVLAAVAQEYQIDGQDFHSSISIGVSIFPHDGQNYEELRRNADRAMYRAKASSTEQYRFFDASMAENLTARMELEKQLRRAVQDRSFITYFQPKIDLNRGCVTGFEALIRWVDASGAIRAPGEFIEAATRLGLLDEITMMLVDDVAAALPRFAELFSPAVDCSINLSASQMISTRFVQELAAKLNEYGISERIILEVVENESFDKELFHQSTAPLLKQNKLRLSIDDFGTGYSNLSKLAVLGVSEIKIDRSFVTGIDKNLRTQKIFSTIENFGRSSMLMMTAEGVETEAELAYLINKTSINVVQGFYFAKPQDINAIEQNAAALNQAAATAKRDYLRLVG